MNPNYRFNLQLGENGEKHAVHPIYKSDLALDYQLESNQHYYRASLSGKLTFVRDDYTLIMGAPFETVYIVNIELSTDNGKTYAQYYQCKFMRTDCTIDMDNHSIEVQPDTYDEYNDVLAGIENEYNLIELAPEIERVRITKRPLVQIYIPGDSIVSCFLSGTSWEEDADATDDEKKLTNTYHFSLLKKFIEVEINGSGAGVDGIYYGQKENGFVFNSDISQPLYTIVYFEKIEYSTEIDDFYINGLRIVLRSKPSEILYEFSQQKVNTPKDTTFLEIPIGEIKFSGKGGRSDIKGSSKNYNVYGRYLLDVDELGDLATYEIPDEDIVDNNRNYQRVIGYSIDCIFLSSSFSTMPTQYGRADDGTYFMPPYSTTGQKYYPVAQSTWRYSSVWFAFNLLDKDLEVAGRKEYTLRDAYPIASCINVLLQKIAPNIKHEATKEYSQFLYGDNNPISKDVFTLICTQKSNVLVGEYQTPAQKAETTLQEFTNMLKNVFQCYWFIEDGKFKIEHVSWFKNGGTYTGAGVIGYDLTKLKNLRNGKSWDSGASQITFDKQTMPERYEFEWMDDVTEPFAGNAIEVNSKYVTAGNTEKVSISNFTSDIDLMLLNPSAMSSDGFALFAAAKDDNGYYLPFVENVIDGVTYYNQNGLLAMIDLQPKYYIYDMPAKDIDINGESVTIKGIQRKKKQSIKFPGGDADPDPIHLIKTAIGNGQIEKISITLSSRNINATLKYDTE